jgi:hypothetical protein
LEELEAVCRQAARDLLAREGRPAPAAVVAPAPDATRVMTLPDFPDDDAQRHEILQRLAERELAPRNAPCYGFLAEALVDREGVDVEAMVVVYGARGQHPWVTAAPLESDGTLGMFTAAEPLDHSAMPFLEPLQRSVDQASPPDVMDGGG